MYLGNHAITILVLPEEAKVISRDYYSSISVGDVIEIDNHSRYIVTGVTYRDSALGGVDTLDYLGLDIQLAAPAFVCELHLMLGELNNIRGQFFFKEGFAIRDQIEDTLPKTTSLRLVNFFTRDVFRECFTINQDIIDVIDGKLSRQDQVLASQATVFVIVSNTEGDHKTYGSGFFVNPYGYIISSGHIFWQREDFETNASAIESYLVEIVISSGKSRQTLRAKVIHVFGHNYDEPDLAFLKLDTCGNNFLCLSYEEPSLFESVIALGFPSPDPARPVLSFRRGEITSWSRSESTKTDILEHSAGYDSGISGGPLVSSHCDVLGVNDTARGSLQQTRSAISSQTVYGKLLAHAGSGHGPYFGPSRTEVFRITIAKLNDLWSAIDSLLFEITPFLTQLVWGSQQKTEQGELESAYKCFAALQSLSEALNKFISPFNFQRAYTELTDGINVQKSALDNILRMAIKTQSDDYKIVKEPLRYDEMHGSDTVNLIQDGRTKITYAVNNIVGQFWSSNSNSIQNQPFRLNINMPEGYFSNVVNILGDIFQRHRGDYIAYIVLLNDKGRKQVVYDRALVSKSQQMLQEIESKLQAVSIRYGITHMGVV